MKNQKRRVDKKHLYKALRYARKSGIERTEETETEYYEALDEGDVDFIADLIEKHWEEIEKMDKAGRR